MISPDPMAAIFFHGWNFSTLGSLWLPNSASSFGPEIQWLWDFWYWMSVFFTVLITGITVWFCIKYRFRKGIRENADPAPDHHTPLEITWSVIPLILMLILFIFGFKYYMDMDQPPSGCYKISVLAWKWHWQFTYPDDAVTNTLYIPLNTPVEFVMTSKDVLHGFWIPDLSIQRDVIPGRTMTIWVKAIRAGHYKLQCAEYCGDGHSEMLANVIVMPIPAFKKKLAQAADIWMHNGKVLPLHVVGKRVAQLEGCLGCHSVNGARGTGPTWKNLAGSSVQLVSGSATADYAYLKQAILYPGQKMVAGFNNVMPDYYSDFAGAAHKRARKLDALIWYINTLSTHASKTSRPPVPDLPGKAGKAGKAATQPASAAAGTAQSGKPAATQKAATQKPAAHKAKKQAAVKKPADAAPAAKKKIAPQKGAAIPPAAMPLVALGKKLYASMGCIACHTVNGTPVVGPSWKNLAGYPVKLTTGKTVIADYQFLRFMILQPGKKLVAGYPNIMPSFTSALAGKKNAKKLNGLIWYINSLSDKTSKTSQPPMK